jgi:uncharacterized phage-associated protein
MPVSALAVANAFLALARRDGRRLTNMQLQKLVYIAHGWSLALLGRPLFYNGVNAWQWGPVIPSLYEALKKYGAGVVTEPIPTDEEVDPSSQEMAIIREVWKAYGHLSAMQLSGITHQAGTPWYETWNKERYNLIPNALIARHYLDLLNEQRRSGQRGT